MHAVVAVGKCGLSKPAIGAQLRGGNCERWMVVVVAVSESSKRV